MTRLTQVRVVPGDMWLCGKWLQDAEWAILRKSFGIFLKNSGRPLDTPRTESVEFDERYRCVHLIIESVIGE